jgi:hypothetical protein
MKVAFLTEMGFTGKVPGNHPNMRTEFAWMHALNAEHFPIPYYPSVSGFDFVFIIWPKARLDLNAQGSLLSNTEPVRTFNHLCTTGEIEKIIPKLKEQNKTICYVQEGPGWLSEDYTLQEQIYYHIIVSQSDIVFVHNESDKKYYSYFDKLIYVLPSLLIEDLIVDLKPDPKQKVLIGGNFCRWYGGMKSYLVAKPFEAEGYEVWAPSMHNKQPGEEQLIKHLPYLHWSEWMKTLTEFKLGIHMMPTAAAGTFSLNCAYLGIPVIGNRYVDTQRVCHPYLSIDPDDVGTGLALAQRLLNDQAFYQQCSLVARSAAKQSFVKEPWLESILKVLKEI